MSTPNIPFQSDPDLSGSGFRSNRISIRPQKGLKLDLDPSGSAAYKLNKKYNEMLIVILTVL
jgi:hypothetical protein